VVSDPIDQLVEALSSSGPESVSEDLDRVLDPAAVVRRARGLFPKLAITRLGEITGLDIIGIPVAIAVRPNSRSLSVSQGKGLDRHAALASAAMEAIELAVAESLPREAELATFRDMSCRRPETANLAKGSRCQSRFLDPDLPLPWVEGYDLVAGHRTKVAWPLVGVDYRRSPPGFHDSFQVSSDGLASGITYGEAIFHGLCELIERDASALLGFLPEREISSRIVAVAPGDGAAVLGLVEKIADSDLSLAMIDMTSDLAVPAFMAIIHDSHATLRTDHAPIDFAGGCGCHPLRSRAMIRAITEACQSRLTIKSGSRDDFAARLYQSAEGEGGAGIGRFSTADPRRRPATADMPYSRVIGRNVETLVRSLVSKGLGSVIAVPLEAPSEVCVVRMLVPELETEMTGKRSTIGRRALRTLVGAAVP
jgi:YcaO-like protein with predicted kinase domain